MLRDTCPPVPIRAKMVEKERQPGGIAKAFKGIRDTKNLTLMLQ